MRIGLIAPPWLPVPPPSYGGTEEVVDVLARGLHRAGHEVRLFTTGDATCPVSRFHVFPEAVRERLNCSVPELYHVLAAYRALEGCDVIHDHTVAGPFVARSRGRSIVTTNHNDFSEEIVEIYRWLEDGVAVVAVSHNQASRAGDIRIARIIHHGLDADDYRLGAGGGDYLLFLGRMDPTKGVHHAIASARAAGRRLLMAAKLQEASELAYFHDRIEPMLGGDVTYVGEVDRFTKRRLLAGADALINPITWPEPFGLVMVEALASGTPVVAFRQGAAPEIVDDGVNGYLCDDESDLVRALESVGEIDRQTVRHTFEQRFTAERMVRQHIELYEAMIEGHPGPRGSGVPPASAPGHPPGADNWSEVSAPAGAG